jgi:hypothetical protein
LLVALKNATASSELVKPDASPRSIAARHAGENVEGIML